MYFYIFRNLRNYAIGLLLASILILGSFTLIYTNSLPQFAYSSNTGGDGQDEVSGDSNDGSTSQGDVGSGTSDEAEVEEQIEEICDDGIDNDGDLLIDLEDTIDCPTAPTPGAPTPTTPDTSTTTTSDTSVIKDQVQQQQQQQEEQQQEKEVPGILEKQQPQTQQVPPLSTTPSEQLQQQKEVQKEICNNKDDDDGDGKIDQQDVEDCPTTPTTTPTLNTTKEKIPTTTLPIIPPEKIEPNGSEVPRPCITQTRLTSLVIDRGNVPGGISATGRVGVTFECQDSNGIDSNNINNNSNTSPTSSEKFAPSRTNTPTETAAVVQIKLSSSDTSIATVPEYIQISIPPNIGRLPGIGIEREQDFTITTFPVPSNTYLSKRITISASLDEISKQAFLEVLVPYVKSLTLQHTSAVGGNDVRGIVELTGPAASGGKTVNLNSAGSEEFVQVDPTTLTIPAGFSKSSFTVHSVPVLEETKYTINALTVPADSKSAELTLTPVKLQSVMFDPSSVVAGTKAKGVITLTGPAPPGGIAIVTPTHPFTPNKPTIRLQSSDAQAAYTPGSYYDIEEGERSGEFPVRTSLEASAGYKYKYPFEIKFTASYNQDSKDATLSLVTPSIKSFVLSEYEVEVPKDGSKTITAKVDLTGPSYASYVYITTHNLYMSDAPDIGTPATVSFLGLEGSYLNFPRGSTSEKFQIKVDHCPITNDEYCAINIGLIGNGPEDQDLLHNLAIKSVHLKVYRVYEQLPQ